MLTTLKKGSEYASQYIHFDNFKNRNQEIKKMAINKLFGPVKSDSKNFVNFQEKHPRQIVINKAGLPGSVFPIKEYFPGKFKKL